MPPGSCCDVTATSGTWHSSSFRVCMCIVAGFRQLAAWFVDGRDVAIVMFLRPSIWTGVEIHINAAISWDGLSCSHSIVVACAIHTGHPPSPLFLWLRNTIRGLVLATAAGAFHFTDPGAARDPGDRPQACRWHMHDCRVQPAYSMAC